LWTRLASSTAGRSAAGASPDGTTGSTLSSLIRRLRLADLPSAAATKFRAVVVPNRRLLPHRTNTGATVQTQMNKKGI
jgi:hypothetical protein